MPPGVLRVAAAGGLPEVAGARCGSAAGGLEASGLPPGAAAPHATASRCLCHIAPGATGKAHETASAHRDPQAPLVVRAVKRA